MQDIYFRGRQPIPELLRIGLTTDHLAETLRLHPPEKLRGDVYLYVATPQGTRDVARLLPEEGYTYPVRRDITQRAGALAAYAEVQGADGMVWHSVPFTLVVAPLPGADKPLDAAQMTAMQQALTELRKLAARAEAAAERLEAGGAGGVTPEQYGAAGDGVADDHDALAAAAEAAVAAEKPLVLEKGKVYRIAQQWQLTDNLTIEGSGAVILTDIPGMTGPDRAAISIWGRSNDDYIKGITIRNLTIRAADSCTSNYMLQAARCRGLTLSHMVFDCEPNTQSRSCMDFYGAYEDMLVENCVFRQLSAAPEGGVWVRTWTNAVESRNVRFLNCDFLKAGGDEVFAVWGWGGTIKDVLISGCTFTEIEDPAYWVNPRYRPMWFITLGQTGTAQIRFVNNVVRSRRCECAFRLVGANNDIIIDNCTIDIDQDRDYVPDHDFKDGANPMLAMGNGNASQRVIRNCRCYFRGDSGRRLTYRMGTIEGCAIDVEGLGGLFASTILVRNNVINGKNLAGGFNDCTEIRGNKITLTESLPSIFAGYGTAADNEIDISASYALQGSPLCGSSWGGSVFSGNRVKWTLGDGSLLRRYQYGDTSAYVRDNRFETNAALRLADKVTGYLYRQNNFFNGMPEKLFPCTGVAFAEAETTVNYKKRMAAAAEITPENCTDPVIYTFTGGDELLALTGHGRYTPKADGVVTVTASCGSYEASQKIKIALLPAPCESLKLNRTTAKVAVGGETYIKVLFAPYWTTDELVWESTAPEVATVDATGAVRGAALGNATIRVTCGSLTAECAVAVVGAAELPVYTDGVWALDGSVAYVPLPDVGEEHTLYIEMKVDLDTITAKDGYVPLLGTGANGATGEAPVTLGFMRQNNYPTYDWRTIGADGPGRVRYINTGVWSEEAGAGISYFLKAGGVYNPGSENALWPMELTEGAKVQPYSGVLAFNVGRGDTKVETFATPGELAAALTAGKLHASAAKGYQITKFILYAHDDYVTLEDVLKYREGADVDIRFDAAGNPVNAGTAGKLVWSAGVDTEKPDTDTTAKLGTAKLGKMALGH